MSFQVGAHERASSFVYEAINHVIQVEGGYVYDVHDSGGETNYGITQEVAQEFKGQWKYYTDTQGAVWKGNMLTMPIEFAADVYTYKYFYKPKFHLVDNEDVAKELLDTGVNCGTTRPVKWLQELLNVLNNGGCDYPDMVVDGYLGNTTFNALDKFILNRGHKGWKLLYNGLNCKQGAFYIDLATKREKDEKFIYGWLSARTDFM